LIFAFCIGVVHAQSVSSQFTESVTTTGVDTTPPSVPTNLKAMPVSQSEIDLSWNPSTDNMAVGGYVIWRDNSAIATTTSTNFADTLLIASTTYTYAIQAFDTSYNYSSSSDPVSTSTFPVPIIPPTPTSTPSTAGQVEGGSSSGSSLIYNVNVTVDSGNADVSFSTILPAQSTVSWGLSPDYEGGSISNVLSDTSHQFILSNLEPETHYYVRITVNAVDGAQSSFNTEFTTAGLPGSPLPNPSNFSAVPTGANVYPGAINLSWTDTTDPRATEVRIVRSTIFYPSDQFDGVPVYEGSGKDFRDTSVVAGKTYYYGIFSEGANGLFSSGVLTNARISLPGEAVTFASSTNPFAGITFTSTTSPMIDGLVISDFEFIQGDKELPTSNNKIDINGMEDLTIRLSYNKVPQVLKTIAVTLNDPTDHSKAFIFLLRANSNDTYYEASIGPLGRTGIFPLTITILDYQNQGLKQLSGELAASVAGAVPVAQNYGQLWFWIGLVILIVLLIIFAIWRKSIKENKKDEEKRKIGEEEVSRDTPLSSASDASGSLSARHDSAESPSLDPRRPSSFSSSSLFILAIITVSTLLTFSSRPSTTFAAYNPEVNYQGKLTSAATNMAVADGQYPISFSIYTTATGGSAIWTEQDYGTNQVTTKSGLFSVMLGSTTPLTGVNFNQTLYLGVTVASDTEMTPRKIIGAVPAAFYAGTSTYAVNAATSTYATNAATSTYATSAGTSTNALSAQTLQNITPGQFFRNDIANATSSATTSLSVTQSGAGKIAEFFGSALQSVLAILSNGNVGIGSSTPSTALVVSGTATVGNIIATSTTATSTFAIASSSSFCLGGVCNTSWPASGTNYFSNSGATTTLSTGTNLAATLGVFGTLASTGTLAVNGAATLSSTLNVTGNTALGNASTSNLTTTGFHTVTGTTTTGGLSVGSLSGLLWGTSGAVSAISTSSLGLLGSSTISALTTNYLSKWNGSSFANSLIYDTGTYVGIGTSSPSNKLEVAGNGFFSGNLTGANITATGTLTVSGAATLASSLNVSGTTYVNGDITGNGNLNLLNNYGGGGDVYFSNTGSEVDYIGEGVANPGAALTSYSPSSNMSAHIDTNPSYYSMEVRQGLNSSLLSSIYGDNTGAFYVYSNNGTKSANVIAVNSDGTTEFGDTSGIGLNFDGDGNGSFGANLSVGGILTTSEFFSADISDPDSGSHVGINNSSPGYTLDVGGDVNTSGCYRVSGTCIALSNISGLLNLNSQATGTLGVAHGGTGATTLSGILVGNGTSALNSLTLPSFLSLTGSTLSLNTLGVANGGTGTSTAPGLNQLLIGNGSGGYSYIATTSLGIPNYFSNSGATTTLTIGTNLAATNGVFGNISATSTATSTFTGGISANCFSINGGACLSASGGTNYFSNSGSTTTLSTGTNLAATLGVFGSIQATSTTATSTLAGGLIVNGNVGIGTTSLSSKLSVAGNISTNNAAGWTSFGSGQIVAYNPVAGGSGFYAQIPNLSGSYGGIGMGYGTTLKWLYGMSKNITDTTALVFYEDGMATEARMTIATGGKVGIGTTSPIDTLSVTGIAGANPFVVASSSNAQLLTLLQNGNLGVGSSTPSTALVVSGTATVGNIVATSTIASSFINASTTALTATNEYVTNHLNFITPSNGQYGYLYSTYGGSAHSLNLNGDIPGGASDVNFSIQAGAEVSGGLGSGVAISSVNDAASANLPIQFRASKFVLSQFGGSGGILGINQNSPTTALDVNGDITDENVKSASCIGTDSNGKIISASCGGGTNYWTSSGSTIYPNTGTTIGSDSGNGQWYISNTYGSFSFGGGGLTFDGTSGILTAGEIDSYSLYGHDNTLDDGSGDFALQGNGNVAYWDFNGDSLSDNAGAISVGGGDVCTNSVCLSSASDIRLKQNIVAMGSTLQDVMKLDPITYDWNNTYLSTHQGLINATSTQIGFIAQDVQNIFPEVVTGVESSTTYLGIDYAKFAPILVKAIQEQQGEISSASSSLSVLSVDQGSLAVTASTTANALYSLTTAASTTATTLSSLETQVQSLSLALDTASSTTSSQIAALASTTASMASSTATALSASQSFIQTIATAVQNMFQSAGNWVIAKLTATQVYATDIQTQTLEAENITSADGIETSDASTGAAYCIRVVNGTLTATAGHCSLATTTPATTTVVNVSNDGNTSSNPFVITNTNNSIVGSSTSTTVASSTDSSTSSSTVISVPGTISTVDGSASEAPVITIIPAAATTTVATSTVIAPSAAASSTMSASSSAVISVPGTTSTVDGTAPEASSIEPMTITNTSTSGSTSSSASAVVPSVTAPAPTTPTVDTAPSSVTATP
jgi:hypothetical protein